MTAESLLARRSWLERGRSLPLVQPLRQRGFRLLWAGQAVSLAGDQFHYIALAWLALQLTGSGLALGGILMASVISRIAFSLLGGAVTDRLGPWRMMLTADVVRAVVVGVIAVLVLAGRIEIVQLLVLAIIFGAASAFFGPAQGTLVPILVDRERLASANALLQGTIQLATLVGPISAGVAVAAVGSGWAFAIDAASFAVAALTLLGIDRVARHPVADAASGAAGSAMTNLGGSIVDGARYVWKDRALLWVILIVAVINFASAGPIDVGLPWLAAHRYDGGSIVFGLFLSAYGGGAVVGVLIAGSRGSLRMQGPQLLGMSTIFAVALTAVGLTPPILVTVTVLALTGVVAGYFNVLAQTWLQQRSAAEMLGRVLSIMMLGAVGLTPISLGLAGILVDTQATLLFAGAAASILLVVVAGATSRTVRELR